MASTEPAASPISAILPLCTTRRVRDALIAQQQISARAAVISSYALCGFANFGSLAILLGGVGAMVPERRAEIAQLGLKAILAGTLATMMTASVVAVLA